MVRAATLLVLVVALCSFLKGFWFEPGSVWAVSYSDETATSPFVTSERNIKHLWGKNNEPLPAELDPRTLRVSFASCLRVEHAIDLPLQLVAAGEARLLISGNEALSIQETSGRGVQGKVIHFEPGAHALRLDFASRGARPALALNASFDGKAPQPAPARVLPAGVRWSRPVSIDSDPCVGP